jgi:hypothetical protein
MLFLGRRGPSSIDWRQRIVASTGTKSIALITIAGHILGCQMTTDALASHDHLNKLDLGRAKRLSYGMGAG